MPFMRPRQQFIALEAVVINTLGYNLPQTQITVNPHLNWRNAQSTRGTFWRIYSTTDIIRRN